MRIVVSAFLFSLTFIVVNAKISSQNSSSISIGTEIPMENYKMEDVSGEIITLNSIKKKNGLLVIFSCNTCPYVIGWQDRYIPIGDWTLENNVGFVLVNSNEAQRNDVDALEKMREHAANNKYNTFYAVDKNSELADAFGASRTPEVFLFDANGVLVYKGAIDDNSEDADSVEKHYLGIALQNLLSGTPNNPSATKSIGCTIKRLK